MISKGHHNNLVTSSQNAMPQLQPSNTMVENDHMNEEMDDDSQPMGEALDVADLQSSNYSNAGVVVVGPVQ